MFKFMPDTAQKWADEMKEGSGKKHPIKGLPKRVKGSKSTAKKTKAAVNKQRKAAQRKKKKK